MNSGKDDERRSRRSKVLLMATVDSKGARTRVRIVDLSAHGALVSGVALEEEAEVVLLCGGAAISGWVAWARAGLAGIQFAGPIARRELLGKEDVAQQVITRDTRSLDFKRPGFRGNQLTPEQTRIVEEWTEARRSRAQRHPRI
jgi:hypothetical protein